MFVHGGVVGVTRATREYPWTARVMTRLLQGVDADFRMTSVILVCNCQSQPHRDVHNLPGSQNMIVPVMYPTQGGEVWTEESQSMKPKIVKMCGAAQVEGVLKPLSKGLCLDPRKWHATEPWQGNRMILVGYSLSSHYKLPSGDRMFLKQLGFQLPWKSSPPEAAFSRRFSPTGSNTPDLGEHSLISERHAGCDESRDAAEAPRDGRGTSHGSDETPAGYPNRGVDRGESHHDDRARCSQGSQQVQDQGSSPGSIDRSSVGVHSPTDHRPAPSNSPAPPHGDPGASVREELHGIWEVLPVDIWRGGDPSPQLQHVVHHHRQRGERVPLEVAPICPMGAGSEPVPETRDQPEARRDYQCSQPSSPTDVPAATEFGWSKSSGLNGDRLLRNDQRRVGDCGRPRADSRHDPGPEDRESGGRAQGFEGPDGELPDSFLREAPQTSQGSGGRHDDVDEQQRDGVPGEGAEDLVAPGEFRQLPFSVSKHLGSQYEVAMMNTFKELCPQSVMLVEVGGSEQSCLVRECERMFGKGSAVQLARWNGGDLETPAGRAYVTRTIAELKPQCVWFSPDSTAYSRAQRFHKLHVKRAQTDLEYEGLTQVFRAAVATGTTCVLALVDQCEAWSQGWLQDLERDLHLYRGSGSGCQFNVRDYQGCLVCRSWGFLSTDGALVQNMSLVCDGKHSKGRGLRLEGLRDSGYTKEFSRRVCRYLQRLGSWFQTAQQMQQGSDLCFVTHGSSEGQADEAMPPGIQDIPVATRQKIFQNLRRIHTATGHCSKQYLQASLKKRGASSDVMRCVEHFKCDVCAERCRPDPRSTSTLVEIVPKWHTLQCDAFSWNHPESGEKWQFMLGVDEGSRMRVGRLLFQHASKTPSAQDFISFFEGHWLPNFGKPQVLRLDPAGCFRSKHLDEYLSERQIEVQHIPAEAHWQISVAERSIQTLKNMMSAMVSEQPTMTASEAFYRAIWASNNRDQYRGYTPLQHAFGRAPNELGHLGESLLREAPILTESGVSAEFGLDLQAMHTAEKTFLEEQAKERIRRAELAGARPMKGVYPGDLVFAWRRMTPKTDGGKHFKGGKFVGPYRVLATETRVDNGQLRASHVVWLYRGGQLIKATPQQLRPASAREEAWHDLKHTSPIPWTISETLRQQPPHQYEDIMSDTQHMPKPEMLFDEEDKRVREEATSPEHDRARRRIHGKQAPNIQTEVPGPQAASAERHDRERSRSIPLRGRGHGREMSLQTTADSLEVCGVVFPDEESSYWKEEGAAVTFSVELPQVKTKQGKEWTRDLGCFFVKQLRCQAVEVSERRLNERELEGFRKAKQKEVKNFVVAKAFQNLPSHMKPSRNQVLKMRWLLTWKLDEDHKEGEPLKRDSQGNALKPKARAVVLGYMDPQYEHRPTSSPTMSRTTRQLFLQSCTNHDFQVEKGDISGAFFRGMILALSARWCVNRCRKSVKRLVFPPKVKCC